MNTAPPIPAPLQVIRRIRWVMIGMILFDIAVTYAGQPSSYWKDPSTVQEGNRLWHSVMTKGPGPAVAGNIAYLVLAYALASLPTWRLAGLFTAAFMFGHFFGASTWITYHFKLGAMGMVVYALFAAICVIIAAGGGFSRQPQKAGRGNDV